jgi:hypothetical protein
MIDPNKILTGQPNQAVTGAILSAPLGTPLPATAIASLNAAFKDSGFISEDGVTTTIDKSYEDIRDWSGKVRRKILKETSFELEFNFLSFDLFTLEETFGKENVIVTEPTTAHGEQVNVKIIVDSLPKKSYVINMKDGLNRMRIVIPTGEIITDSVELSFKAGEAIIVPVKLTAYPDSDDLYAHLLWDDGNKTEVQGG